MRPYSRWLVAIGFLALVLAVASQAGPLATAITATNENPPEQLLPDLRTLPPRDIEIVLSRPGPKGERRLRFDNRIWNAGRGTLEVYPVSADCDRDGDLRNDRKAVQRIFLDTQDDDHFTRGGDTASVTHDIGCMVFHSKHHHWHIEDFATYELYAFPITTGANPVAASTKVSFCMIDTFSEDPTLEGAPGAPYYRVCARDAVYGISIGSGDEYHSTLADQWIVINGVAEGDYCLVSTANPAGLRGIQESDYTNNSAGVVINILGTSVANPNPTLACSPP